METYDLLSKMKRFCKKNHFMWERKLCQTLSHSTTWESKEDPLTGSYHVYVGFTLKELLGCKDLGFGKYGWYIPREMAEEEWLTCYVKVSSKDGQRAWPGSGMETYCIDLEDIFINVPKLDNELFVMHFIESIIIRRITEFSNMPEIYDILSDLAYNVKWWKHDFETVRFNPDKELAVRMIVRPIVDLLDLFIPTMDDAYLKIKAVENKIRQDPWIFSKAMNSRPLPPDIENQVKSIFTVALHKMKIVAESM